MNTLRNIIVAILAFCSISFSGLIIFLLTGKVSLPSALVAGVVAILALNIGLCIFSLININSKKKLIYKIWLSYFVLMLFYPIADYTAGQIVLKRLFIESRVDETVHHELVPNSISYVKNIEYSIYFRVNNIGCRGEDIKPHKTENVHRILMLGDSFTLGKGVNDNETFSAVLEKLLNEKEGVSFEVINCGVNSYAPILEYLQLKQKIDKINPDTVILNFDMSDMLQEYVYRQNATYDNEGNIIAVDGNKSIRKNKNTDTFSKFRGWLYSNMLTISLIHEHIHYEKLEREILNYENVVARPSKELLGHTFAGYDDELFKKQFNLVKQSITKINDLCKAKGCRLILSSYPWAHQVNDLEWVPGRYQFVPENIEISDRTVTQMEELTEELDIPFINSFSAFRNYDGVNPLYFQYDMHWTKYGHIVMANAIKDFLDSTPDKN